MFSITGELECISIPPYHPYLTWDPDIYTSLELMLSEYIYSTVVPTMLNVPFTWNLYEFSLSEVIYVFSIFIFPPVVTYMPNWLLLSERMKKPIGVPSGNSPLTSIILM